MSRRFFGCCAMLGIVAACESDFSIEQATIQWLEWPAEVQVAMPFEARALLVPPACVPHTFEARVTANASAVTLAPYFLVNRNADPICPPTELSFAPLPIITLDTAVAMPGLNAPGTLEMRATTPVDPAANTTPGHVSARLFGDVTVRAADPDTSRRNAGGLVIVRIDEQGCARIQPAAQFNPGLEYVLENQADSVGLSYTFVRGYLHEVPTPVCGFTRVFHRLLERD